MCLWSPICVLWQSKLVGESGGEIPVAWGLEEAGQGRVGAWAVWGPEGLSLSSPEGMGTVPGNWDRHFSPPHSSCHVCFVRSQSLD